MNAPAVTSPRCVVVFGDFNCPFCYALEERLLDLGLADQVSWRGVQHAPELPIPMPLAGPRLAAELRAGVAQVRRLAPDLPIIVPAGKPNTGPAIFAVAKALLLSPSKARQLKQALYRELWRNGADLSNPALLAELAHSVGLPEVIEAPFDRTVPGWQRDWRGSGIGSVPALVRTDGQALVGLVSKEMLRRLFGVRPPSKAQSRKQEVP